MRGFWKGLMSPMIGATPYNATVFTTKETVYNMLGNHYPNISTGHKNLISGCVAGACSLIVYNPTDVIKVRAQLNRETHINYVSAISKLVKFEGFSSLYKGCGALLMRDMPGYGIYFWFYDFLK